MAAAARISGTAILASLAVAPIEFKDASNVAMDVGLLTLHDGAPLDPAAIAEEGLEAALRAAAQDNAQLLLRSLFELPVERDHNAGALVRCQAPGCARAAENSFAPLSPPHARPPPPPSPPPPQALLLLFARAVLWLTLFDASNGACPPWGLFSLCFASPPMKKQNVWHSSY